MIDFRYHLVSIIAVFLALGLGILIGSSLVPGAAEHALQTTASSLQDRLRTTRTELTAVRQERDRLGSSIDELAPWLTPGRLAGRSVVAVFDGGTGRWRDGVRDAMQQAGARPAGSLTLTDRWAAPDIATTVPVPELLPAPTVAPASPAASAGPLALETLGRRLLDADGRTLLTRLSDAGFVRLADIDPQAAWPPAGALVVVFSPGHQKTAAEPGWLAALAKGAGAVAPALALARDPSDYSAVTLLRAGGDLPKTLVTFDAAGARGGALGAVLAADAAVRVAGGHFGIQSGHFFPKPPGAP